MTYALSAKSLARLEGVDPRLVAVVQRAIELSSVDFLVTEGLRTKERQAQLYAQGRTVPGRKVTWTLDSKHIHGLAVDVAPLIKGAIPWNDGTAFDAMAKAMFTAAKELGVPIRWGADWDRDGNPRERGESDSPHFELAA
jgi:peptidoglycan L-alanyl-D-glutamate endopeptidase CwlK